MASYGVWWVELVAVVLVLMCLGLAAREAAAFIGVARLRRRDGGTPAPRTRDEYLLLFPKACPRCLSRRGRRLRGWHRDPYGSAEFVETLQCAECGYVEGDREAPSTREAETTAQPVTARPRWFISPGEADQIARPRL